MSEVTPDETPVPDASVETEAAPAASDAQEVVQPTAVSSAPADASSAATPAPPEPSGPSATPGQGPTTEPTPVPLPTEAQPAAEASAPAAVAPTPEPDPSVALKADNDRLTLELQTLQEHYDRVYAEYTQAEKDRDQARAALAAEQAKPSTAALQEQLAGVQGRLEQAEAARAQAEEEKTHLVNAQPAAPSEPPLVHLTEEALGKVKSVFLAALAEHAVAQVAPEAEPEAPSPFINRAG